ncbi:MAG: Wzz/FepE/Etk N-terminal domain-containing protein [Chitinivibrionales bacterium]|nr:Wzz/FepE/Etk N-terminal domain-containing protein [Chitinivibrionales bacterium]
MDQFTSQPRQPYPMNAGDPDEINLLEYLYVLLRYKWWIIGLTLLGLIGGYALALVKGPTYVTEAVIAPKETESQKTPNFAGLGALGGLVAGQLNTGGNASLDKISTILDTRKFNADLIEHNDLLPFIYQKRFPKVYKKNWDAVNNCWKKEFKKPEMLSMGALIKSFLKKDAKSPGKPNTMTLSIQSKDSTFSRKILEVYLVYLNNYLKSTVQDEARASVAYLDTQLITISDPLLREKIQALAASEMEKAMVVSKEAFKILDPPYSYVTFKQKKLFPMVFAAGCFFMSALVIFMAHAFSSSEKNEEDKKLLLKIKSEMNLNIFKK